MTVIYALKDPGTGDVRYIGKANDLNARMREHRWEAKSSTFQTHKVRWLRSLDGDPIVKVLEVCTTENWAERERFWIKRVRRGGARLTNIADGGQTSPVEGRGHAEETKAKLRASAIARGVKPPSRAGTTPWNKGTKGAVKPNDGTFKEGRATWNEGLRKTHCVNGHELTSENRYYRDGRYRGCRICIREASKRCSQNKKSCRTEEVGQ